MEQATKQRWIAFAATTLYAVICLSMCYTERFWVLLIPVVAFLVWFLLARMEVALTLIAFSTPFAIDVTLLDGMQLSMPSEPLMILFSFVFLARILIERSYDRLLLRHSINIALLLMLAWMAFCAIVSVDTLVSVKYIAARCWFIVPFFYATAFFCRDPRFIWRLYWAYVLALCIVVAITTMKTLPYLHELQMLHRVMKPFYNDHTAYGCVLALFIPITLHGIFRKEISRGLRLLYILVCVILSVGLALSFCRAAWLSLAASLGVYILVRLGIRLRWMVLGGAVVIGLFFAFQDDILYQMGKNTQDSSATLSDQIQSMSNISTDASNLERLNRWACAIRMFADNPMTGNGPGTYQFYYSAYQRSYQLSTISTNAGDLGNAHSEYIGPLAEQGVFGALFVVLLFIITFVKGVEVYRNAADPAVRHLALALAISLLSYYIHGIFNNFLDTDKLSVPFWFFTAAIMALDCNAKQKDVLS